MSPCRALQYLQWLFSVSSSVPLVASCQPCTIHCWCAVVVDLLFLEALEKERTFKKFATRNGANYIWNLIVDIVFC